ncbi:MAG: hypothetical protein KJ749_03440 [Planctomycetes bacterium]|nr:hypothetical protein [Planctomycetota bacterium]
MIVAASLMLVIPAFSYQPPAHLQAQFEQALADFDQAQTIQTEDPDRARQLFRSAAQRFESVAAAGIANGRLEFNLGNCYLQAGDVGKAIAHYRRAEMFIPRDPLLADNLTEARSRRMTAIKSAPRSTVLRSVFFWHYDTSFVERCRIGIILYVTFWVLLTLRSFRPSRALHGLIMVTAVLTLSMAGSIAYEHWSNRHRPNGVLTAMDVAVYKGPGTGYNRRFEQPLQPGVEFTLREARGGWWNIQLVDGQTGWIETDAAELITPLEQSPSL